MAYQYYPGVAYGTGQGQAYGGMSSYYSGVEDDPSAYYPSAYTLQPTGTEERGSKTTVVAIACCLLFVVIFGIGAFAVLGTLSSAADDSIASDVGALSSGGGTPQSVPIPHVVTTEGVTSTKTEDDTTPETEETAPPDTEAPPPTPPPEPEPIRELVCTVGETAVHSLMYPEDGLCDYIYYTNVVVLKTKLKAVKIEISWNEFIRQMKKRSKTGGGIGFDYRYLTVANLKQAKIIGELTGLVKENIKHYGLLNIIEEYYNILEKKLDAIGALIAELKNLQHGDSTRKTIVAMGLFKYDENIWESYKKTFKRMVDDYAADTVIAISSVGALETEQDCFAVPPSVTTKHAVYPSLERHGELVKASFQYQKEGAVVGLSLEMGVLTYLLRHEARYPADIPYETCWSAGPVSDASMIPLPESYITWLVEMTAITLLRAKPHTCNGYLLCAWDEADNWPTAIAKDNDVFAYRTRCGGKAAGGERPGKQSKITFTSMYDTRQPNRVCPRDLALVKHLSSATLAGYVMGHNKVHVFFGDNVKTIQEKVQYIKAPGLRKQFSLLLFNVHLTDLHLRCFVHQFQRVSEVKTLLQQY